MQKEPRQVPSPTIHFALMNLATGIHQFISSSVSHLSPPLFPKMIQMSVWPAANSYIKIFTPKLYLEGRESLQVMKSLGRVLMRETDALKNKRKEKTFTLYLTGNTHRLESRAPQTQDLRSTTFGRQGPPTVDPGTKLGLSGLHNMCFTLQSPLTSPTRSSSTRGFPD